MSLCLEIKLGIQTARTPISAGPWVIMAFSIQLGSLGGSGKVGRSQEFLLFTFFTIVNAVNNTLEEFPPAQRTPGETGRILVFHSNWHSDMRSRLSPLARQRKSCFSITCEGNRCGHQKNVVAFVCNNGFIGFSVLLHVYYTRSMLVGSRLTLTFTVRMRVSIKMCCLSKKSK